MALPVIAGVFRITLNWSQVDGVTPRNVFHVMSLTGDETDVGPAIDDGIANMASPTHLFHCCDDAMVCSEISILPLDGTSPGSQYTLATALTGGSGTSDTTAQAAGIISMYTGTRGPRGRGRLFAGPLSEAHAGNGKLDSTTRGLMNTAWDDFNDGLIAHSPSFFVVVASYTHADAHPVLSFVIKEVTGTQRRRVDQLR